MIWIQNEKENIRIFNDVKMELFHYQQNYANRRLKKAVGFLKKMKSAYMRFKGP